MIFLHLSLLVSETVLTDSTTSFSSTAVETSAEELITSTKASTEVENEGAQYKDT